MPELQHGAQSARCVVCCFTGHAGHAENCSDMQTYVDNVVAVYGVNAADGSR